MRVATQSVSCVALAGFASFTWAQPNFQGLGDLPGGDYSSRAFDVSADGSVVVGVSSIASGTRAFRWTAPDGMQSLGVLGGYTHSLAIGVSPDGFVIVGTVYSDTVQEAFWWTAASGMLGLGWLAGSTGPASAQAASTNGQVIVGQSFSSSGHVVPFRRTPADGMQPLNMLPSDLYGDASDVSADGTVIIGDTNDGHGGAQGLRWGVDGQPAALGVLPGGTITEVSAVSTDGSVIVGAGDSASGYEGLRWTASGGMVGLGHLLGGNSSTAFAVSGNGNVVVGQEYVSNVPMVFIWDLVHGMRNLQTVLETDFGLDLGGWRLIEARGISADGATIVGTGWNPQGHLEAWVAHLPTYPTPVIPTVSGWSLILLGVFLTMSATVVLTRRRRRGDIAVSNRVGG